MSLCPYCKRILKGKIELPYLPPRQRLIYDEVSASGRDGILPVDLLRKMYGDKHPPPGGRIVMRVQVYELNKKISSLGQHIKGGQHYRLIGNSA